MTHLNNLTLYAIAEGVRDDPSDWEHIKMCRWCRASVHELIHLNTVEEVGTERGLEPSAAEELVRARLLRNPTIQRLLHLHDNRNQVPLPANMVPLPPDQPVVPGRLYYCQVEPNLFRLCMGLPEGEPHSLVCCITYVGFGRGEFMGLFFAEDP